SPPEYARTMRMSVPLLLVCRGTPPPRPAASSSLHFRLALGANLQRSSAQCCSLIFIQHDYRRSLLERLTRVRRTFATIFCLVLRCHFIRHAGSKEQDPAYVRRAGPFGPATACRRLLAKTRLARSARSQRIRPKAQSLKPIFYANCDHSSNCLARRS